MSEAKKGFALLGGAAVLALAVTCLGGTAGSATGTAAVPAAIGPSAPAAPPTTSTTPITEPSETIFEEPHDLGGGAGGGMG